jgi:hypothetical protein
MISEDLANATRRLWSKVETDPGGAWAPWVSITNGTGADMICLLSVLLTRSKFQGRANVVIPVRKAPCYQELARLYSIAPWSELFELTDDGTSIRLSRNLTIDDIEVLFRIYAEHTYAIE